MSVDQLRSRLSVKYQEKNVLRLPESLFKRALTACSSDLEAADLLISNYIEVKKSQPYFFANLQDDQFYEAFGKIFSTVSTRSDDGQLILSLQVAKWDPAVFKLTDLMSAINLTLQCLSLDEKRVKSGLQIIVDTEGMGFKYVAAVKPLVTREFIQFMFMSCPADIKSIIAFNCNYIVNLIYGAIKPFLPKSITERVIIMSQDYEKLAEYLGEGLVKGGKYVPDEDEKKEFIKLIESNRNTILEEWSIMDEIIKDLNQ